jgi:uncharacterized protein (UPF0332 family)
MKSENIFDLALVRLDRAKELILEAETLLEKESFKSANNRAYYATEKALKSLLALKGKDSKTHNGVIILFDDYYVRDKNEYFDRSDLKIIRNMEKIRNASDYDDFYIAGKAECKKQVCNAKKIIEKVERYLQSEELI